MFRIRSSSVIVGLGRVIRRLSILEQQLLAHTELGGHVARYGVIEPIRLVGIRADHELKTAGERTIPGSPIAAPDVTIVDLDLVATTR
jgi:hypothetical protein